MAHGVLVGDTFIKNEKEKDQLRMGGGSWTVNLEELPKTAQALRYISENHTYDIAIEDAITFGFERILGGERKLVVPLKHWNVKERA